MSDQYLSAERLGISHEERAALIKVAGFIGDAVQQDSVPLSDRMHGSSPMGVRFNMSFTAVALVHCGTVACLGGHVWLVMQDLEAEDLPNFATTQEERDAMTSYVEKFEARRHEPLAELYYPHYHPAYQATPEEAARATINFLATGNPQWIAVLAGSNGEQP